MFDDTLQREEEQEVFNRLVELTERGKIHWECEEYIPMSFMDKDTLDGQPAYLSQMFTLTLQVQDVSYELEMDEYLTVPEGKGDIALKLTRPMTEDYMQLETALSLAPENITVHTLSVKRSSSFNMQGVELYRRQIDEVAQMVDSNRRTRRYSNLRYLLEEVCDDG